MFFFFCLFCCVVNILEANLVFKALTPYFICMFGLFKLLIVCCSALMHHYASVPSQLVRQQCIPPKKEKERGILANDLQMSIIVNTELPVITLALNSVKCDILFFVICMDVPMK